jgi:L-ascorbate metabolism protein UlaG (beta-lactamase superfamily)
VKATFHGHACFVLERDGKRVIIDPFLTGNPAADTGLTMEMQLLAGPPPLVDLMLVPIGDNYTMGVEDAVRAVEFVKPKNVIPMHYNTWDVIKADPAEFQRRVGSTSAVTILKPGESFTLP